jgi:primosomal protein N' (replication factor Y)
VYGPEWPPIDRINNFFLMEILLKFEREKVDIAKAKSLLNKSIFTFQTQNEFKSTQLILDVDPY